MYENGIQVNRYANKMKHKKEQRKKAATKYWYGHYIECDWTLIEAYEEALQRHYETIGLPYFPYKWWQEYYLSGARKYAKDASNSKLRSDWKRDIANKTMDELEDLGYANANRYFDYDWTIW